MFQAAAKLTSVTDEVAVYAGKPFCKGVWIIQIVLWRGRDSVNLHRVVLYGGMQVWGAYAPLEFDWGHLSVPVVLPF